MQISSEVIDDMLIITVGDETISIPMWLIRGYPDGEVTGGDEELYTAAD